MMCFKVLQMLQNGFTFLLTIISCLLPLTSCDCSFPHFLHNNNNVTWFMNYHDNKDVVIRAKPTVMYVTECKTLGYRSCQRLERHCSVDKGGGKFLVREIHGDYFANDYEATYRCFQFYTRGKSVVQYKASMFRSETTSASLCDDENLILDNVPMISHEFTAQQSPCPLIGGYDFKLYQYGDKNPLCDDIFLPLRIESDCTSNEGIKLYFRRRNCSSFFVGRPIETDPVRLQCIATWAYSGYTYSIVKWHGSSEFWCVRVTYKRDKVQQVNIYFNSICPTNGEPHDRMLILKHFKVHYVTNICEDENLVCSYHHCSTRERDSCKLSCSLCEPQKEERPCYFSPEYHGYWNSLQSPTTTMLLIGNQTIMHERETWHCVTSTTSELLRRRRVLKLKFQNGCHPRYMCIDIEKPAQSVLRFRSGTELHWPIEGLEEVCDDRYFDYMPTGSDVTGVARTSGPWSYYINDSPKYVTCNLPWYIGRSAFYEMRDRYGNHSNYGCLINKNDFPSHTIYLHYTTPRGHGDWKVYYKKTFVCLASMRFIGENDVLITKNVEEDTYMCWSFYRDAYNNYVSIYSGEECGNGTNMQLVVHTINNTLATLVLHKNSSVCDVIENGVDQKVMTRRSDDALSNLTENNTNSSPFSIQYTRSKRSLSVILLVCFVVL